MDTPTEHSEQGMYDIHREVRDRIDARLAEAENERTAHSARQVDHGSTGGGVRSRVGRAVIALGALIADEPAPHRRAA